jgi:hypothetical protein
LIAQVMTDRRIDDGATRPAVFVALDLPMFPMCPLLKKGLGAWKVTKYLISPILWSLQNPHIKY